MKCRRSKTSRGARLRELAAAKLRTPTADANAVKLRSADRARAPGPTTAAASELRIDGPTQGAIHYEGAVVVGPNGEVKGGITAMTIVVEGKVLGDLYATQSLRIAASGVVVGDLTSPRIGVARGAQIQGRISTRGRRPAANGAELDEHKVVELLTGA
jgi:cytoskeletal protein CcmA (bactofilin family)